MEVKIGVSNVARELVVDTDASAEDVEAKLAAAVSNSGVFALVDTKGRRVVVPADKVAYLEFGSTTAGTVGFR